MSLNKEAKLKLWTNLNVYALKKTNLDWCVLIFLVLILNFYLFLNANNIIREVNKTKEKQHIITRFLLELYSKTLSEDKMI